MVYLQTLNYLPIILIISADKNEIMPICKEKEKYEHMQLIADYADKPSYLQICLFIGRYCRYTDKPIYGNAKSADTDIVSAAYLQIVSADNFIGCSLEGREQRVVAFTVAVVVGGRGWSSGAPPSNAPNAASLLESPSMDSVTT